MSMLLSYLTEILEQIQTLSSVESDRTNTKPPIVALKQIGSRVSEQRNNQTLKGSAARPFTIVHLREAWDFRAKKYEIAKL